MAMPFKKDNTPCQCSPTSALENKWMLSHLGEELRTRILPDSNKFIVEILGSHFCACANISMMTAKDGCKLILLESIQSNASHQPVSSLHELLQFYGGIWNE
jgi:hypothetical protein